jgi:hypothetical protein
MKVTDFGFAKIVEDRTYTVSVWWGGGGGRGGF